MAHISTGGAIGWNPTSPPKKVLENQPWESRHFFSKLGSKLPNFIHQAPPKPSQSARKAGGLFVIGSQTQEMGYEKASNIRRFVLSPVLILAKLSAGAALGLLLLPAAKAGLVAAAIIGGVFAVMAVGALFVGSGETGIVFAGIGAVGAAATAGYAFVPAAICLKSAFHDAEIFVTGRADSEWTASLLDAAKS